MVSKVVLVTVILFFTNNVRVDSAAVVQSSKASNPDWWKNAVIYQIYPRSFKDSDNNGIGDLKGITSKLEHLKDAGVTAAWLSPIYKSPQVDHGYDISDYMAIDEDYGTMEDFDEMLQKAHQLGIKIVMDFVPNHSSNEHEWFVKSENKEKGYEDFYIWVDGKKEGPPPSNWISHFKGTAWSYSEKRKQWYLHQFTPEQPDLNYRNRAVKREMKNILTFWLNKGVDGFRMDAVPYLVEDSAFTDEPLSNNENAKPEDYEYLNHTYTSDLEETYDIIYDWRAFIDKYNADHSNEDPRIIMTEAYTSLTNTMKYYTDGKRDGAHFTFNFFFITDLHKSSKAQDIVTVIDQWMNEMPKGCVANWVLGNHDNFRVATRFGPERVDGMNTIIALLPGVMVTYNGEEIGMENGKVSKAECQDPRACKLETEEEYQAYSRDFERTPFHWDDTTNAGFNIGFKPWLPVSEKYVTNNLALQSVSGVNSHYHLYQNLIKLRNVPGFSSAPTKYSALSDDVITFTKSIEKGYVYVALINIGGNQKEIDLSELPEISKYTHAKVVVANSDKHDSILPITNKMTLEPYESLVARLIIFGDQDWWKHAVVYQIYPLSFKDSDNSGEGDLRGIIDQLDHLKDMGVTAAWLSPIFESPQVDQGYDISDFKAIDSRFGTMEDFEELVEEAHKKGLKIVLDFVPNHSSNQHEWFVKSENREPGYEDFYVWKDRKSIRDPPNNWKSIFGGSAWTKSDTRNQMYLHQFAKEQPDLNYRNPAVVEAMKDVLLFWLDKGVDGFRMDAVPYLVEDDGFEDEPAIEGETGEDHSHYKHIYTSDQPGTFDVIYQWRKLVNDYVAEYGGDARVLMTEAYTDIINTMKYYGEVDGRDGAHFTFNFQLITKLNKESTAEDIKTAIIEWLDNMPKKYTANWVIGNHDNHRVATRFGSDNADGFNMLIAVLPGVMVTYNGEEIGQENGDVPYSKCKDPSVCGKGEEVFLEKGRDFERTPFHWDNSINAGFNLGAEPWLPVSKKYSVNNLAEQSKPGKLSHYHVYKELLELRNEKTLIDGKFDIKVIIPNVLGCTRTLEGEDTIIYLFNVGDAVQVVDSKQLIETVTPYLNIVLTDSKSFKRTGDLVASNVLTLAPHECIIAKLTDNVPTTVKPDDGDGGGTTITVSLIILFTALLSSLIIN